MRAPREIVWSAVSFGLVAALSAALALVLLFAPMGGTVGHMLPRSEPMGQLSDGDAEPVLCLDDGSLMLTGSVGGRRGSWIIAGSCVQSGRQGPVCVDFVQFGEAEESTCVEAVMPYPVTPGSRS